LRAVSIAICTRAILNDMGKDYQNKLLVLLSSLQRDLKNGKINQAQFNFLLGFLFKHEMNNFIKEEVEDLLPETKNNHQTVTFVSYKRNRKISYAS